MIDWVIAGWAMYVGIAFGLRTAVHWRQTGTSGFVGIRAGARTIERVAGLAMVAAFALAPLAACVGDPLADATIFGAAVLALATVGTLVAQLAMARSWRIGVDPSERTELVTRFPFTVVRNPIFSCMIAASFGLALMRPTPFALVLPALLLAALEVQVRRVEEPYLRGVHGADYEAYARRTGRFFPGLGCVRQ